MEDVNNTVNQLDPANIYRTFYPTTATEYSIFSSAHETVNRTDYMLSHKTKVKKFKKERNNTNYVL